MGLLTTKDRKVAEAIASIGYCNPFLPERIDVERRALGAEFVGHHHVMFLPPEAGSQTAFPNVTAIQVKAIQLADQMRTRLISGAEANETELLIYEDVVLYLLYSRYMSSISSLATAHQLDQKLVHPIPFWKDFEADFSHYLQISECHFPSNYKSHHAFAIFFQVERAFKNIFYHIRGSSLSIAKLRAAVWDSIFTQNMRLYARALYRSLYSIPSLILGPTGSGKELVASAIGRSQFIPFDPNRKSFGFDESSSLENSYRAVNLSALVPTLVESDLFGHEKGAFTGAENERKGLLELCPPSGAVFLDEIGEIDPLLQVKLLRVVQFREFVKVGGVVPIQFQGKLLTATNRDLLHEVREGKFREDLYFRLCADQIQTPSLRAQLNEQPQDLEFLVRHVAGDLLQEFPEEADQLGDKVYEWIQKNLESDYDWPGNIRELEQCVRNVMIRNSYHPSRIRDVSNQLSGRQNLGEMVSELHLTQQELIYHYSTLAFVREGTYEAAAQKLGVNWRTIKKNVQNQLVSEYKNESSSER